MSILFIVICWTFVYMRIKHIDILRGIAAAMVTVFHLAKSTDLTGGTAMLGTYGWAGVQIFFVISGFVLPYSMFRFGYTLKNFGTFILKRMIRIYPAYLCAIFIGIALTLATGRHLISMEAIAAHFLFLNNIIGLPSSSAVFWTLAIEFQFYLLIGLLYPFFLTSNKNSLILLFTVSICSLWFKHPGYIVYWFPFFALGILIFHLRFTKIPPGVFWTSCGLLVVFITFNHGVPHAIASCFAVLFILYAKFEKETLFQKAFLFLGTISYSLYLIHWDLGRAGVRAARNLPLIGDIGSIKLSIGFLLSVLFAWLLYVTVEKSSMRYSSEIKYKQ
jgi:peptidoglycan/LPS O-acetylase OafA/YrhL